MKFNLYLVPKALALAMFMALSVTESSAQLPVLKQCSPSLIPSFNVGCSLGGYINSVTTTGGINNISNTGTGCDNSSTSYSDYTGTSMKVTQEAGKSVTVNVTWSHSAGAPNNIESSITKIYVDWNRDGLFDASEYIAPPSVTPTHPHVHTFSPSKPTVQVKIDVPGSAKDGLTRMRIVTGAQNYIYAFTTDACGNAKYGEAEDYVFEVINPCLPPNTISVANMDFKSADFSWTQKLNSEFYEYVITQVDTIPHDTVVGFTFTQLNTVDVDTFKCDTKYYILVRVICDTAGLSAKYWKKSAWMRDSFTTQPCCYSPEVVVDKVTSTTARFSWKPIATALGYEYAVSTTMDPPQKGTFTTSTMVFQQGLSSKVNYYVHVRSRCSPTPLSNWTKEPFKTLKSLSVDDQGSGTFGIDVFPNPVNDKINILLSEKPGKNAMVTVTDLTGKIVYNNPIDSEKLTIDASGMTPGIYIVKYTDEVNNVVMKVTK